MAQDDGQAQGEQLQDEGLVVKIHFQFPQLAPVTQNQQAEPVQLAGSQTNGIGVFQNVGPVLVVIAVRDLYANFMQLRSPVQLEQILLFLFGQQPHLPGLQLFKQTASHFRYAPSVGGVHIKTGGQSPHGNGGQVGLIRCIAHQIANQPMPQAAAGLLELVNVQQVKYRPQNAQAPTDDGAAVVFHAGNAKAVAALRLQQLFKQPVQPLAGHRGCRPAPGGQHIAHGAYCARRAIGHVPTVAAVGVEGLVQHRLGGNFGHLKGVGGELALRKIAGRPGNAAHPVRLHHRGLQPLAQNHFGRPPANVQHQTFFLGRRQHVGHALVNQPGFFTAGYHVNGEAQHLVGLRQKVFPIAGFAQGLGGHGADFG